MNIKHHQLNKLYRTQLVHLYLHANWEII